MKGRRVRSACQVRGNNHSRMFGMTKNKQCVEDCPYLSGSPKNNGLSNKDFHNSDPTDLTGQVTGHQQVTSHIYRGSTAWMS